MEMKIANAFRELFYHIAGTPPAFKKGDAVQLPDSDDLMIVQAVRHVGKNVVEYHCVWHDARSKSACGGVFKENDLIAFDWHKPRHAQQK